MSDNVTPFPAAGPEPERRHGAYEPMPPLSRALHQIIDLARATKRQRDMINRVDSLKALARLPLPTISPTSSKALREVRAALLDELTHELIPNADGDAMWLLCAISLWLREEGAR